MKLFIPALKKYIVQEPFWINTTTLLAVKMYCFGLNIDDQLNNLFDSSGRTARKMVKVEIPRGFIFTVNSINITSNRNDIKISFTQKDNPVLKTKIDYPAILNPIITNPSMYTFKYIGQYRPTFYIDTDTANTIECEEYNPQPIGNQP